MTTLATQELERVRQALSRGTLTLPLSRAATAALGLSAHHSALSELLSGFDSNGAQRMLEVLLTDRHDSRSLECELVWSGPQPTQSQFRDTRATLRQLFNGAREEVILAGYSFDPGVDVFEPLQESMRQHGVEVSIILNVEIGRERAPTRRSQSVSAFGHQFLSEIWDDPTTTPALYYDRRVEDPSIFASMHAKSVVVDRAATLVTSANFTGRGQERNIEFGTLIHDVAFAERAARVWQGLIRDGALKPVTG